MKSRLLALGCAALIVALALPGQAAAQAGGLDTSFGGDGRVMTNFTPGDDAAVDVAIQTDDKIVAAGGAAGQRGRFALVRYNPGGTLDASFGGDGKVATNFTSLPDVGFGVALQPADGKIVAVGEAGGRGGRFALARYNTDGTLDSAFGGDGKVITDFSRRLTSPSGLPSRRTGRSSRSVGPVAPVAGSPSPATTPAARSTRASGVTAR